MAEDNLAKWRPSRPCFWLQQVPPLELRPPQKFYLPEPRKNLRFCETLDSEKAFLVTRHDRIPSFSCYLILCLSPFACKTNGFPPKESLANGSPPTKCKRLGSPLLGGAGLVLQVPNGILAPVALLLGREMLSVQS